MATIFVIALLPAVGVWAARRWNKRLAYIDGIAFWAGVQLVLVSLGPSAGLGWLLMLCVLAGIGVSAADVLPGRSSRMLSNGMNAHRSPARRHVFQPDSL